MNKLQDYWSLPTHRAGLLQIPSFPRHMSRDRFLQILSCLRIARNPWDKDPNRTDILHKIKPLITYFDQKMAAVYSAGKELSIEESMVPRKGRLRFRRYIQNKRCTKLYMLTDSSGLVLKFILFAGSGGREVGDAGHADKVVQELLQGSLDLGHSIFIDSFYNSVGLTRELLSKNTFVTVFSGPIGKEIQRT